MAFCKICSKEVLRKEYEKFKTENKTINHKLIRLVLKSWNIIIEAVTKIDMSKKVKRSNPLLSLLFLPLD
jgi:hypothetical protein